MVDKHIYLLLKSKGKSSGKSLYFDWVVIQFHNFLLESESDVREINLKTSELTKCEWCSVRKLPVVFLQTVPSTCSSLRDQLKMSKDNVWYECKGDSK